MVRWIAVLVILALAFPTLTEAQKPAQVNPLLLNGGTIEQARKSYRANRNRLGPAVQALIKDADAAMQKDLVSVVQKQQTPPSGSKHDYMSLGPYWWPDSTKPDGLPYIRRDGEVNPEYHLVGDNMRIDAMVNNVSTLALAYAVSRDERYASRAVKQVREWFLNPPSRMNPNLEYAQAIKGVNQGRGIGIIETYSFRHLIDAFILLKRSKDWTPDVQQGIVAWFASYLTWLLESPNGKDEAGWKNNHGSAYDVQVSCIALYLGKKEIAQRILREVGTKRIAVQVEPDGSQPLELERTKSWGYSNMNLDALIELGLLGDRVGVDLWRFKTQDGRSIRRAVDFLLPYAVGKKRWTWTQISPFHPGRMYYALTIAAARYRNNSYLGAAKTVFDDQVRSSRVIFSLPRGIN
jgi:hypothetical protein